MEDTLSNFNNEDYALNRELNSLVRKIEHEETVRGNAIDMLAGWGGEDALRFDV